jgi:WhiB family redox-sensing transcriptional regulator
MNEDWMVDAACGEDPEVFFPVGTVGVAYEAEVSAAKAVCNGCPVASNCMEYAMDGAIPYGIFGGMTADERRAIRTSWLAHERAMANLA